MEPPKQIDAVDSANTPIEKLCPGVANEIITANTLQKVGNYNLNETNDVNEKKDECKDEIEHSLEYEKEEQNTVENYPLYAENHTEKTEIEMHSVKVVHDDRENNINSTKSGQEDAFKNSSVPSGSDVKVENVAFESKENSLPLIGETECSVKEHIVTSHEIATAFNDCGLSAVSCEGDFRVVNTVDVPLGAGSCADNSRVVNTADNAVDAVSYEGDSTVMNTVSMDAVFCADYSTVVNSIDAATNAASCTDDPTVVSTVDAAIDAFSCADNSTVVNTVDTSMDAVSCADNSTGVNSVDASMDAVSCVDSSTVVNTVDDAVHAVPCVDNSTVVNSIDAATDAVPCADNYTVVNTVVATMIAVSCADNSTRVNSVDAAMDAVSCVDDATAVNTALENYREEERQHSEDDTEDSSSSSDESVVEIINVGGDESEDEEEEGQGKGKKGKGRTIKTQGELQLEDLPPIEDLQITVEDSVSMIAIGKVSAIVGVLVVIQGTPNQEPIDVDSVLFLEDRKPIGRVFETLGPVRSPFYTVRFNSPADIEEKRIAVGQTIYFAPGENQFTSFVFISKLLREKGSDASWEHNNEPPSRFLDYSDDEEERRVKAKLRKKNGGDEQQNEEEEEEEGSKNNRKQSKQRRKNRNDTRENNPNWKNPMPSQEFQSWPPRNDQNQQKNYRPPPRPKILPDGYGLPPNTSDSSHYGPNSDSGYFGNHGAMPPGHGPRGYQPRGPPPHVRNDSNPFGPPRGRGYQRFDRPMRPFSMGGQGPPPQQFQGRPFLRAPSQFGHGSENQTPSDRSGYRSNSEAMTGNYSCGAPPVSHPSASYTQGQIGSGSGALYDQNMEKMNWSGSYSEHQFGSSQPMTSQQETMMSSGVNSGSNAPQYFHTTPGAQYTFQRPPPPQFGGRPPANFAGSFPPPHRHHTAQYTEPSQNIPGGQNVSYPAPQNHARPRFGQTSYPQQSPNTNY